MAIALLLGLCGCAKILGIEDYPVRPELSALEVSDGALSPTFDPQVTEYTVDLGLASDTLSVKPSSESILDVRGIGVTSGQWSDAIPLAPGGTAIEIAAHFETGERTTYTVTAVRGAVVDEVGIARAIVPDEAAAVGGSVALSGTAIVAGAPRDDSGASPGDDAATDSGAVLAWRRDTAGLVEDGWIKPETIGAGDWFGAAVDVDGDVLVVGAPSEASAATGVDGDTSDNSAADAGAAYVFRRVGGTWVQEAYLKASNTDAGDGFGASVAVAKGTPEVVVVGAPGEDSAAVGIDGDEADNSAGGAGAVYVFVRSGTTWTQQAYLKASNAGAGDAFGSSVALDGTLLAVGAHEEDSGGDEQDNSVQGAGAAYLFERGGTAWSQKQYLKGAGALHFGWSVSVRGDRVAVGAVADSGSVDVFVRDAGSFSHDVCIENSDPTFGTAVAIDGDLLLIGAASEDGAFFATGGAYLYGRGDQGAWTELSHVVASNPGASDNFGTSVALSGLRLAIGAPGESGESDATAGAGACYVYE